MGSVEIDEAPAAEDAAEGDGYSVLVLHEGYSCVDPETNIMKANCTCTLIKGPYNIIVDTMTSWDKEKIIISLNEHELEPEDINYVICTHGHSDHIGNNNLFTNATHIVGLSVSREDTYYMNAFSNGSSYQIDDSIEIIPTPGHTLSDVSVLVKSKDQNVYAITGDLFERAEDVDNSDIWINAGSESPELQKQNRYDIAKKADWIIPGHGAPFQSTIEICEQLKGQTNFC